jgi:hypothetical protein
VLHAFRATDQQLSENRWGETSKLVTRQQISETHESAKCVVFQRGTSRYVFTTDVSVNEVQTFIRDLVLVMGWFTLLDRYGR